MVRGINLENLRRDVTLWKLFYVYMIYKFIWSTRISNTASLWDKFGSINRFFNVFKVFISFSYLSAIIEYDFLLKDFNAKIELSRSKYFVFFVETLLKKFMSASDKWFKPRKVSERIGLKIRFSKFSVFGVIVKD